MPDPVPPTAPPGRFRYTRKLAEYVSIFDTPLRSIKRWIADGRASGDLPPLDDPPQMADWWTRVKKQRTPDKLLKFITVERKSALDPSDYAVAGDEMTDDEPLRQARANLRSAFAELCNARAGVKIKPDEPPKIDEAAIARSHRVYREAAETFQAAQRGADDTARKRGELVEKSNVFAADAEIATQLRQIHEGLPRNVDNRLADLAGDIRERVRTAIETEMVSVQALIRRLANHLAHEFQLT